jgi:hypothetical protein
LLPRLRTLSDVFDPPQRVHSEGETPRHVAFVFNEDMRHTLGFRMRQRPAGPSSDTAPGY